MKIKKFQDESENPAPKEVYIQGFLDYWQYASFTELVQFIIDLPFFLLTIFIALAPWRAWALKKILREVIFFSVIALKIAYGRMGA